MARETTSLGSEFSQVFNRKTPEGKGACLLLANSLATSIATALSGGVFYTAFMARNGIDIVRIGILGSIPSLCWIACLFTPKIMRRFRSRRWILFAAHMVNILCTVLGTTVMPMFVSDYMKRTVWFGVFLLIGNLVNALFNSGNMAWHLHFVPNSDRLRNIYYSYQNIGCTFIATTANIFAALAADALSGTPQEFAVINTLRFLALGFYIFAGICAYVLPKEYPYEQNVSNVRLSDTIRLPLKEKRFLLTASIIFFWNFMTSCNSSTWTYYLKETVCVSFFLMQINSIIIVTTNIVLLPLFRRLVARFSMPTMLRYGILGIAVCQFFVGFVAPGGEAYYVCTMIPNGICWSLVNLCAANAFVYNLPAQNRDVHTVFWNLCMHIAMFLGSNFGAWFLSLLGEGVLFRIIGVDIYSSQVLMWFKFAANTLLSFYIARLTPTIKHLQQ